MPRVVVLLCALVAGCGRIGFEPLGSGDGGPGGDVPDAVGMACPNVATGTCGGNQSNLFPTGSAMHSGGTSGLGNARSGSCGGADAEETTLEVFIEGSATYRFDTAGSDFDTVLYVRDGGCDGAELVCNDNAGGGPHSEVTLALTAGQTIVIVVDGASGVCGNYVLNLRGL